jgi:electron transfer flavoprotein beta subunit
MKFLTFAKHVPTSATTPRIAASGNSIELQGLSYEINEPDLYGIEEALHQKALTGGEVHTVTIGGTQAKEALHVAYAKGVDKAIHVIDEENRGTNPAINIHAAAHVARNFTPDIIFCGVQAEDDLLGQFGTQLAHALDLPVVTAVTEITIAEDGKTARVVREIGAGFKEVAEVDLPCVLTIQFGIRPLRYTPIMAIVRMRNRPVEVVTLDSFKIPENTSLQMLANRVTALNLPPSGTRCEFIEGSPAESAKALLAELTEQGVL